MPLHPLFAERLSIFGDKTLAFEQQIEAFNAPLSEYVSPPVQTLDFEIPTATNEIPARLYRPASGGNQLPALIWFHGGGFTQGGLWQNESDVVAREIAHRAEAVVLAVDYRLCINGVLFPAPQEDGMAALDWMVSNASEESVDVSRIFIGGISAGGALAASVAMRDRDLGNDRLRGQLLNCPILHTSLPELSAELSAKLDEINGFGLNKQYVDERNAYLCGGDVSNAETWWFPGEANDLSGLPAVQLVNCEYDALRASGERYAEQLEAAGVEVNCFYEPGTVHAHLNRYPNDCPPMESTLVSMVNFINSH